MIGALLTRAFLAYVRLVDRFRCFRLGHVRGETLFKGCVVSLWRCACCRKMFMEHRYEPGLIEATDLHLAELRNVHDICTRGESTWT